MIPFHTVVIVQNRQPDPYQHFLATKGEHKKCLFPDKAIKTGYYFTTFSLLGFADWMAVDNLESHTLRKSVTLSALFLNAWLLSNSLSFLLLATDQEQLLWCLCNRVANFNCGKPHVFLVFILFNDTQIITIINTTSIYFLLHRHFIHVRYQSPTFNVVRKIQKFSLFWDPIFLNYDTFSIILIEIYLCNFNE